MRLCVAQEQAGSDGLDRYGICSTFWEEREMGVNSGGLLLFFNR